MLGRADVLIIQRYAHLENLDIGRGVWSGCGGR
jgi:hypothetical protein